MLPPEPVELVAHPSASAPLSVAAVYASLRRSPEGFIFESRLRGVSEELIVPAASRGARCDGLWRHTCVEFFIAPQNADAYLEFNLSPSSDWALYAFRDTRAPMDEPAARPPAVLTRTDGVDLCISAHIATEQWAIPWLCQELRVGLSAVLEARSGERSYHAICHPQSVPDFHDRKSWVARLPACPSVEFL